MCTCRTMQNYVNIQDIFKERRAKITNDNCQYSHHSHPRKERRTVHTSPLVAEVQKVSVIAKALIRNETDTSTWKRAHENTEISFHPNSLKI